MDFQLRNWRETDLDYLVQIADNVNIAKNLTNHFPHPYTRASGEGFIKMANEADPQQIFAIEIEGKASGAIGIHPQGDLYIKNAELGYWLAEHLWGKGIVTRAVQQVVDYGFNTFDITRIYARCFEENIGSQRVLEKVGFTLEASFEKTLFKNGEYSDELVYAIRK